jgi:MoaA/NifB/PqqE/SkfB family radical SAM enzyme
MRFYIIQKILTAFIFNKHLTLKKILNSIYVAFNYFFIKSLTVKHPVRLVFDPTNHCNLQCPLCPTGQGRMDRAIGFMDVDKFKLIIDENYKYLFEVDLYNWGEPLLHKDIYEMISYAESKNIRVTISSTLNYLTDIMAEKIVSSGLERLIVSLDGANQETYEHYRIGGNFDYVIRNVRKIIDIKKKKNSKYPLIIWEFLIFSHNEKEISNAKRQAKKIGFDKFIVKYIRSDMGIELFQSDKEKIIGAGKWLPTNDSMSRFYYKKEKKKIKPQSCIFLWTQGTINWNGAVSPCCAVYDESYDFGNAFEVNSFLEVWNNDKFKEARSIVKNNTSQNNCVCSNCLKNGFIEY